MCSLWYCVITFSAFVLCNSFRGDHGNNTLATQQSLRRRMRRYSHLLGVNVRAVSGTHQRYGAVCSANQCHNRATCVVDDHTVGGFRCQCVRGFYGLHCDSGLYQPRLWSVQMPFSLKIINSC